MIKQSMASPHTFHVPVMGTGFTIDTPARIAKYGISSVVSLVDDDLIEQMRKHYCERNHEAYRPITVRDDDFRAKRITEYLNLLNEIVQKQIEELRQAPFDKGSEITRYFELLPDSPLREAYHKMRAEPDAEAKKALQEMLRGHVTAGTIDVNIMTKLNNPEHRMKDGSDPKHAHALAALRGFALSDVSASIIFSAGLNQQLYSYIADFDDFYPDENNHFKKRIVLKVSDYRSALVQGKILAKKGLWVSEYRIESGLNCGGHAFATKGVLIGPILEEFKQNRDALINTLFPIWRNALQSKERAVQGNTPQTWVTMQGGIGTAEEQDMLLNHFGIDRTGWGTPFLLVPEVTNVDPDNRAKLTKATKEKVFLSDSSPLGIPFWNLYDSSSEIARRERIQKEKPGSTCPKGFLRFNSEFGKKAICVASRTYQRLKLTNLVERPEPESHASYKSIKVMEKSCICHDLAGGVTLDREIDPDATPAICCGPNIVNFKRIYQLEEMIDHIYGRISVLTHSDRPHMFIRELQLYVDYLRNEYDKFEKGLSDNALNYFEDFKKNILEGIEYYRAFSDHVKEAGRDYFIRELQKIDQELSEEFMFELCEATAG